MSYNVGRIVGDHGADEAIRGMSVRGAYGIYPEDGLPVSGDMLVQYTFALGYRLLRSHLCRLWSQPGVNDEWPGVNVRG